MIDLCCYNEDADIYALLSTNQESDDHPENNSATTTFSADLSSTLFSRLSMNAAALTSGFYSFTAARDDAAAYGLLLCRGDLSLADCLDCIVFATQDVPKLCLGANSATIWYDECMLRYSYVSIFATLDESCARTSMTAQSVSETGFSYVLGEVYIYLYLGLVSNKRSFSFLIKKMCKQNGD